MTGVDDERLKRTLKDLIRIPSVNPFDGNGNGEKEIAEHIYQELSAHGLKVSYQRVAGERKNVIGVLEGGPGPTLILNGHMDTVGVENMTIDPFKANEDAKGNIYGRGAADMKGGLAAMIEALESISGDQVKLNGRVVLAAVVDEEHRGLGTLKLVESYRGDGGVVGEPTELRVGIAHKGVVRFTVTVFGRAAHGSVPELGVDAIAMSCCLLSELLAAKPERTHPLLGKAVLHTSTIAGGSEWSKVPDRCVIGLERRTLPGENWETVRAEAEEAVARARNKCPNLRAELGLVFEYPPLETDKTSQIARAASAALGAVTGSQAEPVGLPYWTDGATMSRAGTPSVVVGPGSISQAHSEAEYVPFQQVELAAKLYRSLVLGFLSGGSTSLP